MKRRGFLKAMGIGAAAAPIVAKNAVAELPASLGDPSIGITSLSSGEVSSNAAVSGPVNPWRLKEIARLKQLIYGGLSDEEKQRIRMTKLYQMERVISQNITCLGSVSPVHKVNMYIEASARHSERVMIQEARQRLWRIERDDA